MNLKNSNMKKERFLLVYHTGKMFSFFKNINNTSWNPLKFDGKINILQHES